MTSSPLTDPHFRSALAAMVKKRVPEADADDIVQSAFAEALASDSAPAEPEALRKWVVGVARHKVADYYRRVRREQPAEDVDVAGDVPVSEPGRDLLRWAERELPPGEDAQRTLEWMLREGDGEKLESIAASEELPAPRVRQRVVRLRKHFRTRWAVQVAAMAALGLAILALAYYALLRRHVPATDVAQPDRPITSAPIPSSAPALSAEPTPTPTSTPTPTATATATSIPTSMTSAIPMSSVAPAPTPRPVTTATAAPMPTAPVRATKPNGKTTKPAGPIDIGTSSSGP